MCARSWRRCVGCWILRSYDLGRVALRGSYVAGQLAAQEVGTVSGLTRPTLWQRLVWRLTPLGQVRLALCDAGQLTDAGRAQARLTWAFNALLQPSLAARSEANALLPLVIEQLASLALRQSRLSEAAAWLSRLEGLDALSQAGLTLRYQLIQVLIRSGKRDDALGEARRFVANARAQPDKVAELLFWALNEAGSDSAQQLALSVAPEFHAHGLVETLRMVCLAPTEFTDKEAAAQVGSRVWPGLLAGWPTARAKAHLLRARCAEVAGDWETMLAQTQAALSALPNADETRYWYARALLQSGQAKAAQTVLLRPPRREDHRWKRLAAIAAVRADPRLERVEPCLRALEGEWGQPGAVERALAVAALEAVLGAAGSGAPEHALIVANFRERLARVTGAGHASG